MKDQITMPGAFYDQLDAELKHLRAANSAFAQQIQEWQAAVAKLDTENARLREALEKLAQWADACPPDVFVNSPAADMVRHVLTGVGDIARSALGEGKE